MVDSTTQHPLFSMRILINYLLIFLFSQTLVFAQNTLTGIVRDAGTQEPLAFSQLALMASADTTMVAGTTTDLEGLFELETNTSRFYQERSFYRESRIVTLSFTWRFRDFRERNSQRDSNGIDGDLDGLF